MIQLALTLKMTTAQVIETSVTVNNNSPIQDYDYPDDQTQPTFEIIIIIIIIITIIIIIIIIIITVKTGKTIFIPIEKYTRYRK